MENKEAYLEAIRGIYGNDQGMIDWCVKEAQTVVCVAGRLLPIEKRKVEKRFCFGYSDCGQGPDYMTATVRADNARNNPEYFKRENLKYYREWLDDIDGFNALSLCPSYGRGPISYLAAYDWWEVLDSVGGEARMEALKGTTVKVNGREAYILTDKDREIIREAYQQAMKAHEKKLDSYLKRYGTSKIQAWTWWLDD